MNLLFRFRAHSDNATLNKEPLYRLSYNNQNTTPTQALSAYGDCINPGFL